MSFPTLMYLSDSTDDQKMPGSNKCVHIADAEQRQNKNAITPQDYCLKPGIACIFWTFEDGMELYQYYCGDHLEKHVRSIFKGDTIRVQSSSDKGALKWTLRQIDALFNDNLQ